MSTSLNFEKEPFYLFQNQTPLCNPDQNSNSICLTVSQLNQVKTIFDNFFSTLTQKDTCKESKIPSGGFWEVSTQRTPEILGIRGRRINSCKEKKTTFFQCTGKGFLVSSCFDSHAVGIEEILEKNKIGNRVLCYAEAPSNLACLSSRIKDAFFKESLVTNTSDGVTKTERIFFPTVSLVYDLVWNSTGCFEKIGDEAWRKNAPSSLYGEFIKNPLQTDPIGRSTFKTTSLEDADSLPALSALSLNPAYLKVGAGIASTVFFAAKAYKETRKLLEESRRMPGKVIPRKTEASRLRASAYAGAAAVSAGLSVYTLRA